MPRSDTGDRIGSESTETLGPIRNFVAIVGASFIHLLIRVFGRTVPADAVPWLAGPVGSDYIGDRPYEEVAAREHLELVRRADTGGLLPDMRALDGPSCRVERLHPEIRRFYECTSAYRMDVWSESYFPGNIGLWLLVTTISRKVNQLNFPLGALATAKGLDSEIVLLKNPTTGAVRYAGWYRRLVSTGRAIYTGFYMTEKAPHCDNRCVKVIFPMPDGNATIFLRPTVDERGHLTLSSKGADFGDAGFYRIHRLENGDLRVWRVRTLDEEFRVYLDDDAVLRCDHTVRYLGMPVLHLHYRIERSRHGAAPTSRSVERA